VSWVKPDTVRPVGLFTLSLFSGKPLPLLHGTPYALIKMHSMIELWMHLLVSNAKPWTWPHWPG
jgi:hypothetical protein